MKESPAVLSKEFLMDLYRVMLRIRLCEESFIEPILQKEILCPVHLYSGQEAVAAGICAALNQEDYVFGTHRSHGHYLAKGGDLQELVAEVYCKETGCSRGRGGSMHVVAPAVNMVGSAPIVAGTISLALGASLASRIREDGRVTVSFFGDGATGEGVLFEALNFAAVKCLPIIFVCENNFYSTHLPIRECRPNEYIAQLGRPFGISSFRVDGNQVLKVFETARKAADRCRRGLGPALIECRTYRFRGHVGPDDNIQGAHTDIRPPDEIRKWKKRDPLILFGRHLRRNQIVTQSEMDEIHSQIKEEVRLAHQFAQESLYPNGEELSRYVFKE